MATQASMLCARHPLMSATDSRPAASCMTANWCCARPSVPVARRTFRARCAATVAPPPSPAVPAAAPAMDKQKALPGKHASVFAIGTATPEQSMEQDEFVDWYFRVTDSEHLTSQKTKMKRICANSGVKRRYFHHTEETLRAHPELIDPAMPPSLDVRMDILQHAVPELTATAARRAIAEWGRPASDITHVIFTTYSGLHLPGADLRLASLLGLRPDVQRTMMYFNGCSSGVAALRVAKDIAENNPGARVLVAAADLTLMTFRPPREDEPLTLVVQALFGDGAGAVIVGAGDDLSSTSSSSGGTERPPLFEMVSTSQELIPDCDQEVGAVLSTYGPKVRLSHKVPKIVRQNVARCAAEAVKTSGVAVDGCNDLFWAVHPGGPAILDSVEAGLGLSPEKLAASRHILSEYGNMSGVSTIFALDEVRRRGDAPRPGTLGMMMAFGPGITVETTVLRAV